jgi:NAD(P)-dependent dehydrogenase (short-subunit alcohol dehydrogenase family)
MGQIGAGLWGVEPTDQLKYLLLGYLLNFFEIAMAKKVVILTGASRGVGLAIAHYLLRQSHKLVVVARTEQPLRQLEKQYKDQVAVLVGDLADFSLGAKAVDLAKSRWQRLDGLIVNHGVLEPVKRLADSTAEEWRAAYDINFFSAIAMAKAALQPLRESHGRIVFTSSGAATNAYPTWGAYGSAKAAMNHLAMTIANEEENITAIAVRPGTVDTDMQRDIREKHSSAMDASDAKKFADLKTSGSLLKPEQPGHVMAKLVLDAPKELSGKFLQWNAEELKAFQE